MGHVFAEIELSNPRQPSLTTIEANALADTGALMLCIPEHEDMDLVVNPCRREITVDPASPNIPHARVKSLAA